MFIVKQLESQITESILESEQDTKEPKHNIICLWEIDLFC